MYLFCRARNSAWRVCECENLSICVSLPPSTPISASNPQCMHPSPEWLSVDTAADYGATLYKGMCTTRPVADVATTALDHETPQLHFARRLHCRRIRDAQRQLARQSSSRLSAWSAAVSSLVVVMLSTLVCCIVVHVLHLKATSLLLARHAVLDLPALDQRSLCVYASWQNALPRRKFDLSGSVPEEIMSAAILAVLCGHN